MQHEPTAESKYISRKLRIKSGPAHLIGGSTQLKRVEVQCLRYSRLDRSVLITGESGTGKELVARLCVSQGVRTKDKLCAVNCAAFPEPLLASELFGHEKGAFTGAETQKKGLFEVAHNETVFLDEVGDMSPRMQALLLRFLECGEFQRVGSTQTIRSNVRILAATNRNLAALCRAEEFREDLFFRLCTFEIDVPPLRERPDDIRPIAEWYLSRVNREFREFDSSFVAKSFKEPAFEVLQENEWPGNVRQLKNVVERSAVFADPCKWIGPRDIRVALAGSGTLRTSSDLSPGNLPIDLKSALKLFKRAHIGRALDQCQGDKQQAARLLGVAYSTLCRNR